MFLTFLKENSVRSRSREHNDWQLSWNCFSFLALDFLSICHMTLLCMELFTRDPQFINLARNILKVKFSIYFPGRFLPSWKRRRNNTNWVERRNPSSGTPVLKIRTASCCSMFQPKNLMESTLANQRRERSLTI